MTHKQNHQHVHKTGETVTTTGHYIDSDGERIELKQGQTFPNCPNTGHPTSWRHA